MGDLTVQQFIKLMAEKKMSLDDPSFSVYDSSGGNIDDAFGIGMDDGEISLARTLVKDYPELFTS